jgi:hypothetical protein
MMLRSPLSLAFLILGACGGSTESVCVPGQQYECACAGDETGFQTCDAAGEAFSECDCPEPEPSGGGGGGGGGAGEAGAGAGGVCGGFCLVCNDIFPSNDECLAECDQNLIGCAVELTAFVDCSAQSPSDCSTELPDPCANELKTLEYCINL